MPPLIHRVLARAWMRPVRVLGWLRSLPQRVESLCQRRSALHSLRATGRTPADLAASIQAKRNAR